MKLFFTSDSHFGHFSIMKNCKRPFKSVEEMDEIIINNWNSVVGSGDLVYHLGDVAYRNSRSLTHYIERLNGRKVLIPGNHDIISPEIMTPGYFSAIFSGYHKMVFNGKTIVLCHYPMRSWEGSCHGTWHLHGHSHGKMAPYGMSFDVGVDAHNFMPWSFDEVVERMKYIKESFKQKS
jgi:calcineurin-like phosphoesterase family protein